MKRSTYYFLFLAALLVTLVSVVRSDAAQAMVAQPEPRAIPQQEAFVGEVIAIESVSGEVVAGQQAAFVITAKNTGTAVWSATLLQIELDIFHTSGADEATGYGADVASPAEIAPGETASVEAYVVIPERWEGTYQIEVRMWHGSTPIVASSTETSVEVRPAVPATQNLRPRGPVVAAARTEQSGEAAMNNQAVDIIFAMDTSGSMSDEFRALCGKINEVVSTLQNVGITVRYNVLGITNTRDCTTDTVSNLIPSAISDHLEDWGPATYDLSLRYDWALNHTRLIIPMSDEGPENGNRCYDPGNDRDSITTAIAAAQANNVRVSPVLGTGSSTCVANLAQDLADQTGGALLFSTVPANDLAQSIIEIIGGVIERTQIRISPDAVPADGSTTANVTITLRDERGSFLPNRQVRLISSRGPLDRFVQAAGTTDVNGQFSTTVRSSVPGESVISAEDLSVNQSLQDTARIRFTAVDGQPELPPVNEGKISIVGINSDLPLSGRYPLVNTPFLQSILGTELHNRVRVTVDWRGTTPGRVELSINGNIRSIPANAAITAVELDMGKDFQSGYNEVRIEAFNAQGDRSQTYVYQPVIWEMPSWLIEILERSRNFETQALDIEVEKQLDPLALDIWFRLPGKQGLSRVNLPVGKIETEGVQVFARLRIPIESGKQAELRAGSRYLEESERRRAAGHEWKGLSVLGTEFTGDAYAFARAEFLMLILQPETVGGGAEVEVSRTWERSWLAVLYLFGLPDPTPAIKQLPVGGESISQFINRLASAYITFKGSAGADFAYQLTPERQWESFDFKLGTGAEAGLQADLNVAKVKGYVSGDIESTLFCYRNVKEDDVGANAFCEALAKGQGEMTVQAFAWEVSVLNHQRQCKWPGPECTPSSASVVSASNVSTLNQNPSSQTTSSWRLIPHTSSPSYSVFSEQATFAQSNNVTASSEQGRVPTKALVNAVYPNAEPSLSISSISDHGLLLWTHDNPQKPVGQSHEIQFSHWDGTNWSTPAGVTNDNRLDGAPQVAWTSDSQAVAVWQRLDDVLPPDATLDVTTTQKIEIATATYDANAQAWSPPALLTTNGELDMTPSLARNGAGNVLAVWRNNAAGLLGGDANNPDKIQTAFYNGTWTAPATAVDNIEGLVDLAAAYGNGQATLAYTQFVTPTSSITPTLQLFTAQWDGLNWSTPTQLTDDEVQHSDPQVVYNASAQPLLAWIAGTQLRLRNLATGTVASLELPAEIGIVDEFHVVQDQSGNLSAVFTAQGNRRDLFLSTFDQVHNLWGKPIQLTDDRAAETYPAPALDSNNRLLAAYTSTAIESATRTTTDVETGQVITYTIPVDGQTDLVTLAHTFGNNLTLSNDAITLSEASPAPGDTVVVSATVKNSGDYALDNVAVAFYDGDPSAGGALLTTSTHAQPLASGFTATLTLDYVVPATGGSRVIHAVADPANAIAESDENDNSASLRAFGPDLTIEDIRVDHWGGSDVGLVALVRNIGTTTAPTSTLSYYRDSITGTLAVTDTIPSLGVGEAISLTTPWNYGALDSVEYALVASTNRNASDFDETNLTNNQLDVTLSVLPDLAVSPLYFWTQQTLDGRIAFTGTVYNFGSTPAQDATVGVYAGETLATATAIFTQTIGSLAPGNATIIEGTWDTPKSGEDLYLWVNAQGQMSEQTQNNNLASSTSGFLMTVAPSERQVLPTGSATYVIDLCALGSYKEPVALTLSGLPQGATATISLESVPLPGSANIVVTTSDVPVGVYLLELQAVGGNVTQTRTLILEVTTRPMGPNEYTVSLSTQGSGSVTITPEKAKYVEGEVVTLTALPEAGWRFANWSGGISGETNPYSLQVTGDVQIVANFVEEVAPPNEYALTINTAGSGSVAVSPNKATYAEGETVTLTATPNAGWQFAGWSGDISGETNPYTVTVTNDTTVVATFTRVMSDPEEADEFTLTVNTIGSGSVTVSPNRATYAEGETATLTAVPNAGWRFSGWSGDVAGSSNPQAVEITRNTTAVATFVREEVETPERDDYTLTISAVGSGSVAVEPNKATYAKGDIVTLTATPNAGWRFAEWGGNLSGTANPYQLEITGDTAVVATFTRDETQVPKPNEYALTVNTIGSGSVGVAPDKAAYTSGETVTLTAVPNSGWRFAGWSGDISGTENPYSLQLSADSTVVATFVRDVGEQQKYALTVEIVGNGAVERSPDKPLYAANETVTLTALPDSNWGFVGWGGNLLAGIDLRSNTIQLSMTQSRTLVVTFSESDVSPERTYLPLLFR